MSSADKKTVDTKSDIKKTDDLPKITDQEAKFFFTILLNMEGPLQVNWDAVAKQAGYSNAGVARVRFGQIKKRHGVVPGTSDPSPTKTPATCAKRPAKGSSGRAAKRTKAVLESQDDEAFADGFKDITWGEMPMKSEVKNEIKGESEDEVV